MNLGSGRSVSTIVKQTAIEKFGNQLYKRYANICIHRINEACAQTDKQMNILAQIKDDNNLITVTTDKFIRKKKEEFETIDNCFYKYINSSKRCFNKARIEKSNGHIDSEDNYLCFSKKINAAMSLVSDKSNEVSEKFSKLFAYDDLLIGFNKHLN